MSTKNPETVRIGARLKAERLRKGFTVLDLAESFREKSPDHIKRQLPRIRDIERSIRAHEAGEHAVGPRYQQLWSRSLGMTHEELFGGPDVPQETVTPQAGTVDPSPILDLGGDDVKRRAYLQLMTALGAGTAIPPGTFETIFSGIENALGNPLDLDEWESTVHEYGQLLVVRPTGSLIPDLSADIIAVGELLKRHPGMVGLLRVSAALSGLLAIDLGDMGDERASRISWNTAKRAADASGDRDIRVWVYGRAAQDAAWAGRPGAIVTDLTDQAVEIADGAPSAGLARAHAARVYVAANQRDTRQTHISLGELKRTFDRLPPVPGDQSAVAYRETQLLWAESHALTCARDKQADTTIERTLALYPADARGPRVNLSLMRARVLVQAREIDAGLEHAITTLETPDSMTVARALLTKQILQDLPEQARALPAARELRALSSGA